MQDRFGDNGDSGGVINNYSNIWHRGKDGDKCLKDKSKVRGDF